MVVVGDVFPIGGVVPGVVLGVVPGVVLGVVPVVVLGVVPGVVLGVVVVDGTPPGVLGGQMLLELVLAEEPGIVALGVVVEDGLEVLAIGDDEEVDGELVVVTGQTVEVVELLGLVVCVCGAVLPGEVAVDWEPGTTGVGVIAPVDGLVDCGVWAVAMPTAKHKIAAVRIARVVIHLSPVGNTRWDGPPERRRCPGEFVVRGHVADAS